MIYIYYINKCVIMAIRITESQLKNMVKDVLREFENPLKTLYRGFPIRDEEPTDYKGVFERCGYEIKFERDNGGKHIVYAVRMTGAFGGFNGDSPKEVPDALSRIGIRASFLGNVKSKPYLFAFEIG